MNGNRPVQTRMLQLRAGMGRATDGCARGGLWAPGPTRVEDRKIYGKERHLTAWQI